MSEVKTDKLSPRTDSGTTTLGDSGDTFLVNTGAKLDINGTELILDADADTSITSDTDDQIDIRIAGADDFQFTANTFTAQSGSTIAAQALTATTIGSSAGITITGTTPTLTIGDAGAEDAAIVFDGNAQDFHIGLDDTADSLAIGLGSALGTTDHMVFDATGAVTKPLQPSFLAIASAQNNVAVGSEVAVAFANETFDLGSDYAPSTFTAPVTGKYNLSATIYLSNFDNAAEWYQVWLKTSNRTYYYVTSHYGLANDVYQSLTINVLADMDASDTATVAMYQAGGAQQTDIATSSYFSGWLVA